MEDIDQEIIFDCSPNSCPRCSHTYHTETNNPSSFPAFRKVLQLPIVCVIREALQVKRMVCCRSSKRLCSLFISTIHKLWYSQGIGIFRTRPTEEVTGDSLESLTSFDTLKLQNTTQCFRVSLRDYYWIRMFKFSTNLTFLHITYDPNRNTRMKWNISIIIPSFLTEQFDFLRLLSTTMSIHLKPASTSHHHLSQ
jgi:hypothetical protein